MAGTIVFAIFFFMKGCKPDLKQNLSMRLKNLFCLVFTIVLREYPVPRGK